MSGDTARDFAALVTYGTPHKGADTGFLPDLLEKWFALLLPPSEKSEKPTNPFLFALNDLRSFPFPPGVGLVSLVGTTLPFTDDDCVVQSQSQNMAN